MPVHLNAPQLAGRLQPNTAYAASIEAARHSDGGGINLGMSDQTSDANGHIVFTLAPVLWTVIGRTGVPCTVTTWVRPGGSTEDADPVPGTSKITFDVA